MPKYYWDCYYFNGYTGDCYLKGGNCSRVCKKFLTEEQYYETKAESEIEISLAKLREIYTDYIDRVGSFNCSVDSLLKTIKQELAKRR